MSGGGALSGVQGQSPSSRGQRGLLPLPKAESLLTFKRLIGSRKVAQSSKNLKCKNNIQFVLSLQKMKFSRPPYVTDYCTLIKSNRLVHFG